MNRVPLHLVEAFVTFNESANIVEASKRLGISQPALSKQLQALERMVPQSLFILRGRKKVLTAFGEELHIRLKPRLFGLQDIVDQTASIHADPSRATARIAARREVLDRFAATLQFPGFVQFIESRNEETVRAIVNRTVDIGIVHQIPDTHELSAKPLFKDSFMLLIPRSMVKSLPPNQNRLWDMLKRLPCITYKNPDDILQQICAAHDVSLQDLNIARTTPNYLSISRMVNSGSGWAAVPTHIPRTYDQAWVVQVSKKAFPPRQFYCICRPELRKAPWFGALISEIEKAFK